MLQRPQLRKIWVQEYLARSERYTNVIQPKIKHLHETLSFPYFEEVVRLGIVKRFSAAEIALLWSSLVQNNVVNPYYVELLLGVPTGSPKSVERQVDLVFAIFVDDADEQDRTVPARIVTTTSGVAHPAAARRARAAPSSRLGRLPRSSRPRPIGSSSSSTRTCSSSSWSAACRSRKALARSLSAIERA